MDPIISSTMRLTGKGIQMLRQGNTDAAISVFNCALQESKRMLSKAETCIRSTSPLPPPSHFCSKPIDTETLQHGVSDHDSFQKESRKQHQQLQHMSASGPIMTPASSNEKADYIYKTPFQILLSAPFPDGVTRDIAMPFVVTCMFNLALAHHAHAQKRRSVSEFQIALQLYELAYSVLTKQQQTLPVSFMMMLAILNNLGQVQKAVGNTIRAHRCLSHLLSLLMFVRERGGCGPGQSLDGFFYNTADVVLSNPATAQAA